MTRHEVYDLFIPGNKLLYRYYNPHDNTTMEVAYEVKQRKIENKTEKVELRVITLKTNLPEAAVFDVRETTSWHLLEDLVTLVHEWALLPDNYELFYVK